MQLLIGKLISSTITIIFVALCMSIIKKEKIKLNARNIAIIWVSSIMMTTINLVFFSASFVKPVLSLLIFCFIKSAIYRKRYFDSMGTSFALLFLFFLSEIFYSICLIIFNVAFPIMLNTTWGEIISNLMICLISYIAVRMRMINKSMNSIAKLLGRNQSITILAIIVLLMGILTSKNARIDIDFTYLMNLLLIVIFIVIMCIIFQEKKNKDKLDCEQEILYNYIMKYEKELVEKSKIIHDFKNQLLTIKGFICDTNDKAKGYLDELVNDIKKHDVIILRELKNIPAGGLKGLLYYKFADIEKSGIKLSLNISKNLSNIEKMDMSTYKNLVKIVGVYLDNAIEATAKSKEKKLEIEIYEKNKNLYFGVSNTYSNRVNVSKLGYPGYSSKGKNRGYGLSFVKDILNQNKNFDQTVNVSDNVYSVFLTTKMQ